MPLQSTHWPLLNFDMRLVFKEATMSTLEQIFSQVCEASRKSQQEAEKRSNLRLAQKLNLPFPDVKCLVKQVGRLELIQRAAEMDVVNQDFRRRISR